MAVDLIERLGLLLPILQAPMAGTATPALAAAVSAAGALGGLGLAGCIPAEAAAQINATRALTDRPFNVNLFCHRPRPCPPERARHWIGVTAPLLARAGAAPLTGLGAGFGSFLGDTAMLALLLDRRPRVISFHFGLPAPDVLAALRATGAVLIASATSPEEGRAIAAAGLDAVIAQGWAAGGHRGIFDPDGPDARMGTQPLTRALAADLPLPVIAAGGLMDGHDARQALSWGAVAVQMGTAFIGCPESGADAAYRETLRTAPGTRMTRAVSGRPARFLLTEAVSFLADRPEPEVPPFPQAYAVGDALAAAARASGDRRLLTRLAGEGAPRALALPAATLLARIAADMG